MPSERDQKFNEHVVRKFVRCPPKRGILKGLNVSSHVPKVPFDIQGV